MTEKRKFLYWMAVEEAKIVRFSDLSHMIAKAMHPSAAEEDDYAFARMNLDVELAEAVRDGVLKVRNPASLGRLTDPVGNAMQCAVLLPDTDLEPFLNERGIELRLIPHGSGPEYWTLENVAAALQEQEGWHDSTRRSFQDQLNAAAQSGELVIFDPLTGLQTRPLHVRDFWELVTPVALNSWLKIKGVSYRFQVVAPIAEPSEAPFAREMHGHRIWRLREAIDEIAECVGGIDVASLMERAHRGIDDRTLMARNLAAGGITTAGDNLSEMLDHFFSVDFNRWLDAINAPFAYRLPEPPPDGLSVTPEPQAVAAESTPVVRARQRTLWDVVTPYILEVIHAGQYTTAKQLYNALETKAGQSSPFEKGVNNNRGSLFVRELAEPLALKTLQNKWRSLRTEAAKR